MDREKCRRNGCKCGPGNNEHILNRDAKICAKKMIRLIRNYSWKQTKERKKNLFYFYNVYITRNWKSMSFTSESTCSNLVINLFPKVIYPNIVRGASYPYSAGIGRLWASSDLSNKVKSRT